MPATFRVTKSSSTYMNVLIDANVALDAILEIVR